MQNTRILLIFLFSAFLFLNGCEKTKSQPQPKAEQNTQQQAAITNISVQEANKMIQDHPDLYIIDVRTSGEYTGNLGHVSNSHLMPVQEIEKWAPEISEMKDKDILLICHSGNRSSYAAKILKKQGFKKLYNVEGGMLAWNAAKLPIAEPAQP